MFGTLRLVLAAMVAASHIGVNIGPIWIGVTAVVVFFMISGYAMTGLLQARFGDSRSAPIFYLERIVRLAPQYYFWLICALFCSLYLRWSVVNTNGFLPYGLFAYLAVIPLGLQSFLGSIDTLIMPQATTLGIEITFYMLSPWILKSRGLSWGAAFGCLMIFAATTLRVLPDNIYTYFTSPGPMIFYLLGSFLYRKDWPSLGIFTAVMIAILLCGLPQRFNLEFLLGVGIGLPVMIVLAHIPARQFDAALGNASYGCFLGHGVVFATIEHYLGVNEFTTSLRIVAVILACLVGYLTFYLVERPTVPFRRRLKAGLR